MSVQLWADHGVIRDRFVLDGYAFARWYMAAFGIDDVISAVERIQEIDALAERVVVDGIAYQIPDECYQKIIE